MLFEIEALTKMIRTKLDYNTRTTICSLLSNKVHARDSLKHMIDSDVRYATDFLWRLYMKYEYKLVNNRVKRVLEGGSNAESFQLRDSKGQDIIPQDGLSQGPDPLRSQSSFKT